MKKLFLNSVLLFISTTVFGQNEDLVTASTTQYPLIQNQSGNMVSSIQTKPHSSVYLENFFVCGGVNYGPSVVTFFNEKGGETWMVVQDIDGRIRRSTRVFDVNLNNDKTFHITAAREHPVNQNEIIFTGKVFNKNLGVYHLIAGVFDVCLQNTILDYQYTQLENAEGVEIEFNPLSPNSECVIVGVKNNNQTPSNNQPVIAIYDFVNNTFVSVKHHSIGFNVNDITANLSNPLNIIISGIVDNSNAVPVSDGGCNSIYSRSIGLIDYDLTMMQIVDIKTYSSSSFTDKYRSAPIYNDDAYFHIEASPTTGEYIGVTQTYERLNKDYDKNLKIAVAQFDNSLALIEARQLDMIDRKVSPNKHLYYDVATKAMIVNVGYVDYIAEEAMGVAFLTENFDGHFSNKQAIVTMPIGVNSVFNAVKGDRKYQSNGSVLGVNDLKMEGELSLVKSHYYTGAFMSIGSSNFLVDNSNNIEYVNLTASRLDNLYDLACDEFIEIN